MTLLLTPLSHQSWAEQRVSWGEDGSPTPRPEPLKVNSSAPRADCSPEARADRGRRTGCGGSKRGAGLPAISAVPLPAGRDHAAYGGLRPSASPGHHLLLRQAREVAVHLPLRSLALGPGTGRPLQTWAAERPQWPRGPRPFTRLSTQPPSRCCGRCRRESVAGPWGRLPGEEWRLCPRHAQSWAALAWAAPGTGGVGAPLHARGAEWWPYLEPSTAAVGRAEPPTGRP